MKGLTVAAIFAVALCVVSAAAAWAQEPQKEPEIVATGMGMIEVDPDMARINIRVRGFGKTIEEAAEVCASHYVQMLDTLETAGIGYDRVITRHLDTYPEMHRKKRDKTIGHWVEYRLYIDTRNMDELLEIARYVLYSGVASASVTWLLSSKADSMRRIALKEAVLNARDEAEAMASSTGGLLGDLIELTTHYPENPKFPTRDVVQAMALKSGIIKRSSIKLQKIKVNVSVLGRWRLIGGFEN